MDGLESLKISEEKKKYIVELLNPVLEEMVAECIHFMPENPVPFMLEWLEQKKVVDEDKQLSPEERERIVEENKVLQDNVSKVKSQMQEAAKLAADGNEEEEEEEDDDDDEPPPDFMKEQSNRARTSVSAEAYGEWNMKKAFVPPVVSKTEEMKERLKECMMKSFLFANLDSNDLNIVIGAMKEVIAEPGTRVITQGDTGDYVFVVDSGKLDCLKGDLAQSGDKSELSNEKVVKTCDAGDVFGELALLYNCPRAASVEAKEKSVLWQLDRDTFSHIVKEAAQKKRARYDKFLEHVPLLASMDAYERSQLADALKVESFRDGQTIVSQGEVGHKFYIIEEGSAIATKGGVKVMSYGVGDYFGELALIRNQPRQATVICKGDAKLLSVDSKSFKRLLNVNDLLERSTKYT